MKKFVLVAISGLSVLCTEAQHLPGLSSGNYSGVHGVFSNPANIADSRYRFDVNLFSLNTLVANNQASYSLKNLSSGFKTDSMENQVFGKDAGPASGTMQVEVRGPAVMFNVGKKNSFALTTRGRVFANIVDIDGKLFNKISEDFRNDPSLPYTMSSGQNMRFTINAWSEIGASYGRVITQKGPHFLKGGITLKYLAGAANGYIAIDNFNGTIDQDVIAQDAFLRNTTGSISTGFGGINISDMEGGDLLDMNSTGIGTDIGFVYEFRPGGSALKSAPYKLKVGAAILDLGKIRYEKDMQRSGSYQFDITGSERLSLQELNELDLDDYNAFFEARPQHFAPSASNAETSYRVSLPTSLQLDVDYHVVKGFYVNTATQIALATSKTQGFNSRTYSGVTVTPRYEMKRLGVYLPVNYNSLTKMNAGASFRFGPLFVGSGSIVSALMGKSKQADVYFGFRFGALK